MVIYEQPLNERIRLFMRLEHMFQRYNYYMQDPSTEDIQAAVGLLLDLHEMTSRLDVKSAMLKILDHQTSAIRNFQSSSKGKNEDTLSILGALERQTKSLYGYHGQLGQHLKTHYYFNYVKQRASIAGGINGFDAAIYKHWISKPIEHISKDLEDWFLPYRKLEDAITVVLDLIRRSEKFTTETAEDGFYQTAMNNNGPITRNQQLLRVGIGDEHGYYPEISAGKHRFSIRFVNIKNLEERGSQVIDDVDFLISICGF